MYSVPLLVLCYHLKDWELLAAAEELKAGAYVLVSVIQVGRRGQHAGFAHLSWKGSPGFVSLLPLFGQEVELNQVRPL